MVVLPKPTVQRVVQVDRRDQRLDFVETVLPPPKHLQEEIDFGGCADFDQHAATTDLHIRMLAGCLPPGLP
jgi:hypothetical protein